ncbi:NADH-dependent [FeFe] hydrogenase, group A6 [Qingrenia yutianensis]|uniref:Iron hydrogenase small subunit n=1 Tax=Qingrenia yutianensis TaxID=2763676 RepID=A0A926F971_9FIRM|nr:NADH-dependent [FeFe] hydrogenase, group A6 [Qingrenia yutianensis]MBC8597041.1 iron hydrogenase small subunit [Qingrenia yutianensis]
MVNIKINGKPVEVQEGKTILEAARENNIHIPTLCYLKDLNQIGACRMCLVEIKGARALQAACVYPVSEGLEIYTNSAKVRNARKATLELILSNHERKCLTCIRNRNCELQKLCEELGIEDIRYEGKNIEYELDTSSPSLVRDNNKCILCRRCVAACKNQGISVIDCVERGFNTHIAPYFEKPINDAACIYCGQCIVACPVGALYEKNDIPQVNEAIDDSEKHVVVQVAPAVRAALGEEFGLPIGTPVTGKMVAALKRLGFDKVFDTDTGADLTIMEEGTEFIERFTKGENLPIITSCSPGWVKYCEHNYPEFLPNLSTCKSPMEMFGAVIKSYYAEKEGINKDKIFSVAVMPCTSKKFEASRSEHTTSGGRDIDVSLTTRELARMIKQAGIDFVNLPDEQFDTPFGEATGAGVIFGTTGGVMEAAIRTVYEILEKKPLDDLDVKAVRGLDGVKEATLKIAGKDVKVAIVHGTKNAKTILEKIKNGEKYDFIEIMACPGGCIHGGGQPIVDARVKADVDVKAKRAEALYSEDRNAKMRKSHENPVIIKLYEEFFGEPCGHKSHELLHTHYVDRSDIRA